MSTLRKTKLAIIAGVASAATAVVLLWSLFMHMGDGGPDATGWVAGFLLFPALWVAHLSEGNSPLRVAFFGFLEFFFIYCFVLWLGLHQRKPNAQGAAKGRQPTHSDSIRESALAASRRSP